MTVKGSHTKVRRKETEKRERERQAVTDIRTDIKRIEIVPAFSELVV